MRQQDFVELLQTQPEIDDMDSLYLKVESSAKAETTPLKEVLTNAIYAYQKVRGFLYGQTDRAAKLDDDI
eukprot:gene21697-16162_t